jgi:hypothetical protein
MSRRACTTGSPVPSAPGRFPRGTRCGGRDGAPVRPPRRCHVVASASHHLPPERRSRQRPLAGNVGPGSCTGAVERHTAAVANRRSVRGEPQGPRLMSAHNRVSASGSTRCAGTLSTLPAARTPHHRRRYSDLQIQHRQLNGTELTLARISVCTWRSTPGFAVPPSGSPHTRVSSAPSRAYSSSITPMDANVPMLTV